MSTGKAGCGDRPHWLFRPLFRFQGARPEGAQSLWTGQNSVHPRGAAADERFRRKQLWLPEQLPNVEAASGAESHSNEWVRPTQLGSARSSHMPISGGSTSPVRHSRSEVVRAR